MHRNNVHRVQHTVAGQQLDEPRINRRDAAQHDLDLRVRLADRPASGLHQGGELLPFRIDVEIPMGEIVRLVPQHDGFHHFRLAPLYQSWLRVPAHQS